MKTVNHECYVSLGIAKLLKKAGFDWEGHYPGNFCYVNDNPELFDKSVLKHYTENDDVIYLAPTLEVAQRWLREVANLSVHVFMSPYQSEDDYKWAYSIIYEVCIERYKTYEEAQETGIKKALELILEKGKKK
jgi:hypothetical protein